MYLFFISEFILFALYMPLAIKINHSSCVNKNKQFFQEEILFKRIFFQMCYVSLYKIQVYTLKYLQIQCSKSSEIFSTVFLISELSLRYIYDIQRLDFMALVTVEISKKLIELFSGAVVHRNSMYEGSKNIILKFHKLLGKQ